MLYLCHCPHLEWRFVTYYIIFQQSSFLCFFFVNANIALVGKSVCLLLCSRKHGLQLTHGVKHYPVIPRTLDGYESDSTLVYHRSEPTALTSGEQRSYYNQIQRGGEVPLSGLRKPAPERPKGQWQVEGR